MAMRDFYRTEQGATLRIDKADDGSLAVDILKDGAWRRAPVGMVGLRLAQGTRRLRTSEIKKLPQ